MNGQLEKLTAAKSALQQELLANLGENQKLFEDLAGLSGTRTRFIVPAVGLHLGKADLAEVGGECIGSSRRASLLPREAQQSHRG